MLTKNNLIEWLKRIDNKLNRNITLTAVGGTALVLLNLKESTIDVDFDIKKEKIRIDEIIKIAEETRRKFELGEIDKKQLARLYMDYSPLDNIRLFLRQANEFFPRLNCGVTTIYLKEVFGDGDVIKGRYNNENHTFLLIDGDTVVDITADQYGGPKVYVGPLKRPWKI